MDECERTITKLQVSLETHKKNLQKCDQAIAGFQQEIDEVP